MTPTPDNASTPSAPSGPVSGAPARRARWRAKGGGGGGRGRGGGGGWLRWTGFAFCLLACVPLGLWTFGRVVSDAWGYSQFVSWIPTWMLLLPALALIALGLPARRTRPDGRPARVLGNIYRVVAAWGAIAVVHFTFIEHHLHRAVLGAGAPGGGVGAVRLFQWNAQLPDADALQGGYGALALKHGRLPDVFFISTAQSRERIDESSESLRAAGYHPALYPPFVVWSKYKVTYFEFIQFFMNNPGGPTEPITDAQDRPSAVDASIRRPARWRLIRWYNTYAPMLGIPARRFPQGEIGYILPVTIDTTAELGRPITIWYIDLPSDPFVFRRDIVEFARAKCERWVKEINPRTGTPLLPPPDVIIGDTNIPRGSWSLGQFWSGMHHAYDDAGWGLSATWPRAFPLMHIDHTLLSPWLKATGYKVGEPPVTDHWFQIVDIEKK